MSTIALATATETDPVAVVMEAIRNRGKSGAKKYFGWELADAFIEAGRRLAAQDFCDAQEAELIARMGQ